MSSADLVALRYIKESTLGVTPDDSVKATGTLTGTANLIDTETVTIDGKVYTLQAVLTNVDGHVKVGADLTATLLNLKNAINRDSGVPGTDYAVATTAHPSVDATASDATTLTVRAKVGGTAGNAIATVEGSATASWGGATLAGGTDSTLTALKAVRYTGESLNYNIDNIQSEEIRPDRAETDLVQVSASAAGDINFEMSYGSFDDFLEGVFCGAWATNVLKNGTTRNSFTIQKDFSDMTPEQFHTYYGCLFDGMTLDLKVGEMAKGSFKVMGLGMNEATAQIGGATFPAASTSPVMNAVTDLQDFAIDGVPYSGCISSMSIDVKNNVRAIKCIGSIAAKDMKLGKFNLTGNMEFYFNDASTYTLFRKGTEFAFTFTLMDENGKKYDFNIPRAKFETGEVVAGGQNTDVMFKATWRALYSSAATCVASVTRN